MNKILRPKEFVDDAYLGLDQPREELIPKVQTMLDEGESRRVEMMLINTELIDDPKWWKMNRHRMNTKDYHRANLCRQFGMANTKFLEENGVTAHDRQIGQHRGGNYHCYTAIYTSDGPIVVDSTWQQFASALKDDDPKTFCGTPNDLVLLLQSRGVSLENISDNYGPVVSPAILAAKSSKQLLDTIK